MLHFFLLLAFFLYLVCFDNSIVSHRREYGGLAYIITFGFILGIRYPQVIDYQFDFEKKTYKKIYTFGFIKFPKEFPFEDLKYIAVFGKNDLIYEINLWHGKNKQFTISYYEELPIALTNARHIAEKLHLDISDASNPNSADWLIKENLIELDR